MQSMLKNGDEYVKPQKIQNKMLSRLALLRGLGGIGLAMVSASFVNHELFVGLLF
jgi:hypothetical protein